MNKRKPQNIAGNSSKTKHKIKYPDVPSVFQSVSQWEGLPVPAYNLKTIEQGSDKSESKIEQHVEEYISEYQVMLPYIG
ncbi:hypothetical protein NPIL_421391 [Nephila pilipes]|uniref:Uncharacterized protein n=1 Tax=Nephila pilipes TaxID=299642 RepID=A0A8X6MP24_NEPPI|nr:hypothetical protein NPIL_421391 [Nephila pilipes]